MLAPRLLTVAAVSGYSVALVSRKPRCLKSWAWKAKTNTGKNACATRLAMTEGFEREIGLFQRGVVVEFLELQDRAAVARRVEHFQCPRRPDAVDLFKVRVVRATDKLVSGEILDLDGDVVVLADGQNHGGVLRRFTFLRRG